MDRPQAVMDPAQRSERRADPSVVVGRAGAPPSDGPPTQAYELTCSHSERELVALAEEWNEVADASDVAHPFVGHEWIHTWWRCFGGDNRLELVTARHDGDLVAIAPLMSNVTRVYGLKARRLQTIYNVHTPRLDLIVAPGHECARRAIWRHLAGRDDWDILELDQLPEDSPTLAEIEALARAEGYPCDRWASGQAPYIPLQGSWQDYLDGLASKHRSNLRNRMKRLKKIGEVRLETIEEPGPDLQQAMRDGLRIEAAGWKGDEGSAIRCQQDVRDFYRQYGEQAARRGMLRLQFLTVDATRIAFAYSLRHGNRYYLLKTGYDPDYRKLSPFNVLLREILHDCYERGLAQFDFLGVFDSWKRRWTEHGREHYWLYVFSNTPTARLIHTAKFGVAPRVKELLGAATDDDAEND